MNRRRRRFERKEGKRFEVALPSSLPLRMRAQTVTKRRKLMVLPSEMGAHGAAVAAGSGRMKE